MVIGKPHNGKRGHGVRAARFAVFEESLKLGEPFAETRIAAAVGVRIVARYGWIERGRRIESGFVAIHRHAVRRSDVEASKAQAMVLLQRGFIGYGSDGIRNIGVALLTFLPRRFNIFRRNHGYEFSVVAVGQSRSRSGIPEVEALGFGEIGETLV